MFLGVLDDLLISPPSGTASASRDGKGENRNEQQLKPFMRIVLDEMPEDPNPIPQGSQGTVVDSDPLQIFVDWDNGRDLHLIPSVDKFHIIDPSSDEEMRVSWENLGRIQDRLRSGDGDLDSRCPRCGQLFDCRRGAVSRRVQSVNIMVCDRCGQQEAIEDFVINGLHSDIDVTVSVPAGRNHTGYESEPGEPGKEKLKVNILNLTDWYIVKIWTGREVEVAG